LSLVPRILVQLLARVSMCSLFNSSSDCPGGISLHTPFCTSVGGAGSLSVRRLLGPYNNTALGFMAASSFSLQLHYLGSPLTPRGSSQPARPNSRSTCRFLPRSASGKRLNCLRLRWLHAAGKVGAGAVGEVAILSPGVSKKTCIEDAAGNLQGTLNSAYAQPVCL
jgi:hypothetical protein